MKTLPIKQFLKLLKKSRLEKGLSQKQMGLLLAEKLGTKDNWNRYQNIELGLTLAKFNDMVAISNIFEVDLTYWTNQK